MITRRMIIEMNSTIKKEQEKVFLRIRLNQAVRKNNVHTFQKVFEMFVCKEGAEILTDGDYRQLLEYCFKQRFGGGVEIICGQRHIVDAVRQLKNHVCSPVFHAALKCRNVKIICSFLDFLGGEKIISMGCLRKCC